MDAAKKERVLPIRNRGGEWVDIGDESYRIPPLGFRKLRELQEKVRSLPVNGGELSDEHMEAIVDIVHGAMERNYDIARGQVVDMLDLGNFREVLTAVLRINGGGSQSGEAKTPSQ
jgi:hypothetical protein